MFRTWCSGRLSTGLYCTRGTSSSDQPRLSARRSAHLAIVVAGRLTLYKYSQNLSNRPLWLGWGKSGNHLFRCWVRIVSRGTVKWPKLKIQQHTWTSSWFLAQRSTYSCTRRTWRSSGLSWKLSDHQSGSSSPKLASKTNPRQCKQLHSPTIARWLPQLPRDHPKRIALLGARGCCSARLERLRRHPMLLNIWLPQQRDFDMPSEAVCTLLCPWRLLRIESLIKRIIA